MSHLTKQKRYNKIKSQRETVVCDIIFSKELIVLTNENNCITVSSELTEYCTIPVN